MPGGTLAWARVAQSRKNSDLVWTSRPLNASVTEKGRLSVACQNVRMAGLRIEYWGSGSRYQSGVPKPNGDGSSRRRRTLTHFGSVSVLDTIKVRILA